MTWDSKDKALAIQGVGSLASAWGQYETGKTRNKLMQQQFDYQKSLDTKAFAKQDEAQKNLDDAFADSDFNIKKKKKKKDALGNDIVDDTTSVA